MPHLHRRGAWIALALAALSACAKEAEGTPPVADAGADRVAAKRERVFLDGSGSTAPGGRALTYAWRQVAGAPVALARNGALAVFDAPGSSGTLRFELVVSDGARVSAPDRVEIGVRNRAPVAHAGPDLTVRSGYVITLDGRGSTDPDGDPLEHVWFQSGGPAIALVDNGTGTARFTAPLASTALEFSLVVNDGEDSSVTEDTVTVTVLGPGQNVPPVAYAGPDQEVRLGALVQLGGAVTDPDPGGLTVVWEQTAGPAVTLHGAATLAPAFVAPDEPAELEFTLTASDGMDSGADVVRVTVRDLPPVFQAITLAPQTPRTTDDLTVTAVATDPEGHAVVYTYAWTRNGVAIPGATSPTLAAAETTRGDVITAVVTATAGASSATAEASVEIADSPPVLSSTAPQAAPHGAPLVFQITLEDPDGDPVPSASFRLDHGPAGMTVSPAGVVSFTPTQPLFGPAQAVSWSVVLDTTPPARVSGSLTVVDPERAAPVYRGAFGTPAWNGGLLVQDLDGDGRAEALVGGQAGAQIVARVEDGYAVTWAHPFAVGTGEDVSAVAAADVDGDGTPELFLSGTGALVALDGATRRERARFASPSRGCTDLEVADLDLDGALELVCLLGARYALDDATVVVLDAATLTEAWRTAPGAGTSLAIGNVDADPALELVTASGLVYDGATGANQWAYGPGFGTVVDTGDLDGDGVEEIVGMQDWSSFSGFSAALRTPLWQQTGFDFDALLVADLDADGVAEVVTGDGQWGAVRAWSWTPGSPTLTLRSWVDSQDHGVSALAAGDLDGDGALELVWGSGLTSSGADVLVVASALPLAVEWKATLPAASAYTGARLTSFAGSPTLLFGRSDNAVVALDVASGALRELLPRPDRWSSAGSGLAVADLDGDGEVEVATPAYSVAAYPSGQVQVVDPVRGAVEWTSARFSGVRTLEADDLTGDGVADLVIGATDGVLRVYDVASQALVWQSTSTAGGPDVQLVDLDGDGQREIVALTPTRVVVHRRAASGPVAFVEAASRAISDGVAVEVADCDGDGAPEVYVLSSWWGASSSRVTRLDAVLQPAGEFVLAGAATAIAVEDLGFPRQNLLVALGSTVLTDTAASLLAIDAETGAEVWRSPPLRGAVSPGAITYVDAGEGERALALGARAGVYLTR